MITLYALGSLEAYKEVFNCKLFNRDKKKCFRNALFRKSKKEVFACENIKLLKQNKKKFPIDSQIGMYIIWIKDLIKKILWINKAQK